ncbi:TetR/AcrR family transcriptional regulator [Flexivirga oryzae]|uniref:AcrR family transcriptional regulator n=1 Tax=Flexivirga oryzae TaxID=1794944 RepID=A0A839NGP1_9MICO|nr:TetR/AcrR family transcriptional regulator [Flexivirga oryzae]MBB2893831.1 AcrR family transcriptional regulator [Flexivirga oryzae]
MATAKKSSTAKRTSAATTKAAAAKKTAAAPKPAKKAAAAKKRAAAPRPVRVTPVRKLSDSSQAEPGTKRGRATRERLLAAALVVFERKGFLETNVSDICKEAGAAHGTFYIYFKSKEDVWYVLVDRSATKRQAVTTAPAEIGGTAYERFAYTLQNYFHDILEHPAWTRTQEQAATIDDKTRIHRLEIRRVFRNRILHGIERLQDAGLADPGAHAEIVAEAIVSMLHNFAYMNIVLADKPKYDIDEVVETMAMIWARSIGLDVEHLPARQRDAAV